MKLTVKDLFDIPLLKNFKLVAGEGGLSRPVEQPDILDFEFVQGVQMSRKDIFDKNSMILTSLLFAKDDHNLICEAVRKLYELNVSCMAYKPVLVKELPKEAIDYANAHNFPILEFGGDEFFEDIIFEVNRALEEGDDIEALEKDFNNIMDQELTPKEEFRISKKINPDFKRFMKVVAIKDKTSSEEIFTQVKKLRSSGRISKKAALCKYRDCYLLFLSQDVNEPSRFDALLTDIFIASDMEKDNVHCGVSSIKTSNEYFGKIVREAYWACNVAVLEDVSMKSYADLGIYRLIIPELHSQNLQNYMYEYLLPLGDEKPELFETACKYVLARGDLDATAEEMFCHVNTIRYRLGRLQSLLDPTSNDKEFHENLFMAIRIYLLSQFL